MDELRSNYAKFEAQRLFIYKNQTHLLIYQQTKTSFEGVFLMADVPYIFVKSTFL